MPYATRADMEARFDADEVRCLATPQDAEMENPARIAAALTDADAVIDSFLSTAYALPLPTGVTYPLLTRIACDHARASLYDDQPLQAPAERLTRGIRRLEQLRDGKLNLVGSDGKAVPRRNTAQRTGPLPAMTRAATEGF